MATPVRPPTLPQEVESTLHALFTRVHYSAAGYVFDAQAFAVSEDAPLLGALREQETEDRAHAMLLAHLIEHFDLVPEAGVFPWWHRDLNYLSAPYLANFVAGSLERDLELYEAARGTTPGSLHLVHATLRTIRAERAARLEALRPLVVEAKAREQRAYLDDAAALADVRNTRLAKEKAALERARKAAADGRKLSVAARELGMDDPAEDGISAKERAKRTMMIKRAQKKASDAASAASAPAKAADPAAAHPMGDMPDPNEEGISAKEKAKRTMMIKRAQKKARDEQSGGSGEA